MANIICIINQKGGCGKTTTAINLAASYSRQKRKVLLIDLDPQGNAALGFNIQTDALPLSLFNILEPQSQLKMRQCIVQINSYLDMAPGNIKLSALEQLLSGKPRREYRLKDTLQSLSSQYEFIIIDTPPNLGLLSVNAIMASQQVLVPLEPSEFSLQGAERLQDTLKMITQKTQHRINCHYLLTMHWNKDPYSIQFYNQLQEIYGSRLLLTKIHFSESLKSAAQKGKAILYHHIEDITVLDYLGLSDELEKRFRGIQIQQPSGRKRKGRQGIIGRVTLLNSHGKVYKTIIPQKEQLDIETSIGIPLTAKKRKLAA